MVVKKATYVFRKFSSVRTFKTNERLKKYVTTLSELDHGVCRCQNTKNKFDPIVSVFITDARCREIDLNLD